MKQRILLATATLFLGGCGGGLLPAAQGGPTLAPPELHSVRIGAVAVSDFIELPILLADQLGYFSAAGVRVTVNDYSGGVSALNDLGQGRLDLVSIPYEFTIRSQVAGSDLTMVALYDQRPGLVLSVGRPHFDQVHSMKDLVGKPVCVSAVATASEGFVRWLATRDGVDPNSILIQTCGTQPEKYAAALASGAVWAAQQVDPPFTRLERQGTARLLYDTRSEKAAKGVYGDSGIYPTNGLIATPDFIRRYPHTTAALVSGVVQALHYIHGHSAEQIAAQIPSAYKEADPALYASTLNANLEMFSSTGIMPNDAPDTVLKVLRLILPSVGSVQIDLAQTYDNRFAQAANASLR